MPWDLTVELENRPGTLAELGEALGARGINIDGLCGFPCEGRGILHVMVDDAVAAREALETAGMIVTGEREVIVFDTEDRPGELGTRARLLSEYGINIDLAYLSTKGEIVLGVDDVGRARNVL